MPGSSSPSSGTFVVLVLFAVLAVSVVATFALFSTSTRPEDRGFITEVVLRDLYLPVVAWGLLTAIDAKRLGRSGWWIYLIMAPVPVVNVVLDVQWLRRWRRQPRDFGRWRL